jgi:beta-mannosidase
MKYFYLIYFCLSMTPAIFISCSSHTAKNKEIRYLDSGWKFARADSGNLLPAKIPGCVHLDLLANGIIEDPYFRDNETKVQWIENYAWTYECDFRISSEELAFKQAEIVFEGLDTYADVSLNGKLIFSADNMFRKWEKEISGELRKGTNHLKVEFASPVQRNSDRAMKVSYRLPDERAWSRKAPYQFGWDWGPRLVTSGIWKPVYLRFWDKARIENIQIVQKTLGEGRAEIVARIEIMSSKEMTANLNLDVVNAGRTSATTQLKQGLNLVEIPFIIDEPRLWWTKGLGEPYLYRAALTLQTGEEILDSKEERFGVRTVEVAQDPDAKGKSFFIRLNGMPVFMKGANYIPQDNFPSRVDLVRYESLIKSAAEANMNMLRVWGGGIYENDEFYDLCDENGILVWQDFMFAVTMYPGDDEFLENVREEAKYQVTRLRNHPCIALWCGNNEIDEGWHNWEWQKQFGYSEKDSAEIWDAYVKVFHGILPEAVRQYDGFRFYWPSSPKTGWGHPEAMLEGDMHYWGVWWGKEPFDAYEKKIGRFMSEYGFQGYPAIETIESFTDPEDRLVGSPVMKVHQKHPFGDELILSYMERDYVVPKDLEDYAYISQVNQAEGIRKAIEAHRRAKPYCMGTLYWQLNDCWPVISWSGVDYFNRWKALNYFARNAYEQVLISTVKDDDRVRIYIVSDLLTRISADLNIELETFGGMKLWEKSVPVQIDPNSSRVFFESGLTGLLKNARPAEVVLRARLMKDSTLLASNLFYFLPVKELELQDPAIKYDIKRIPQGYSITLAARQLAKNTFLQSPGLDGHFSDNFFDLLPGESKVVTFIPSETPGPDSPVIKIRTINYINLNM